MSVSGGGALGSADAEYGGAGERVAPGDGTAG